MAEILRHRERGASVFLATPVYEKLSPAYVASLYATRAALGVASELCILAGDCHVDDARNRLVGEFLKSRCEKLVFLDADLSWRPEDLQDLISHDEGVVAGVYRKRGKDGWACRLSPGENWTDERGLMEVDGAATGFMSIQRRVIEKLARVGFEAHGGVWCPILFERSLDGKSRFSGDYEFCRKWKAAGGRVFINPLYRFDHAGYGGCYGSHLRHRIGRLIPDCLQAISEGRETMETFSDLVSVWGNPYAASPEFLCLAVQMAREADSVLELGSGLSTLCLAAVGPVVSVEDDIGFYAQTVGALEQYGLEGYVIHASLKDGWYDCQMGEFDLVVCDGPNRAKADRTQALKLDYRRMLIDDFDGWPGGRWVTESIGVIENELSTQQEPEAQGPQAQEA